MLNPDLTIPPMTSSIEDAQIRGITLGITAKIMRGIIVQTAVVVFTVCSLYFTIKADVAKLYQLREENEKIQTLKFEQLTNQNRLLQTQLEGLTQANRELQRQIEEIRIWINRGETFKP